MLCSCPMNIERIVVVFRAFTLKNYRSLVDPVSSWNCSFIIVLPALKCVGASLYFQCDVPQNNHLICFYYLNLLLCSKAKMKITFTVCHFSLFAYPFLLCFRYFGYFIFVFALLVCERAILWILIIRFRVSFVHRVFHVNYIRLAFFV